MLMCGVGRGSFDVAVANFQDDIFEVKSTADNTHLCGENFDKRMMNYPIAEFQCKPKKGTASDKQAAFCLQMACEKTKCILFLCSCQD